MSKTDKMPYKCECCGKEFRNMPPGCWLNTSDCWRSMAGKEDKTTDGLHHVYIILSAGLPYELAADNDPDKAVAQAWKVWRDKIGKKPTVLVEPEDCTNLESPLSPHKLHCEVCDQPVNLPIHGGSIAISGPMNMTPCFEAMEVLNKTAGEDVRAQFNADPGVFECSVCNDFLMQEGEIVLCHCGGITHVPTGNEMTFEDVWLVNHRLQKPKPKLKVSVDKAAAIIKTMKLNQVLTRVGVADIDLETALLMELDIAREIVEEVVEEVKYVEKTIEEAATKVADEMRPHLTGLPKPTIADPKFPNITFDKNSGVAQGDSKPPDKGE